MDYILKTQFLWHFILAFAGMVAGFFIMRFFTKIKRLQFIVPFFVVLAIGYIYEIIQGKTYDIRSDLVADFAGLFIGILVLIAIDKIWLKS